MTFAVFVLSTVWGKLHQFSIYIFFSVYHYITLILVGLEFKGPVNTIKVMSNWAQLFKANDVVS